MKATLQAPLSVFTGTLETMNSGESVYGNYYGPGQRHSVLNFHTKELVWGWNVVEWEGEILAVGWKTCKENFAMVWKNGRVAVGGRRHGIPWGALTNHSLEEKPLEWQVVTMTSQEEWHPSLTKDDSMARTEGVSHPSLLPVDTFDDFIEVVL